MKLGIIREGKIPRDKRVPLIPKQCRMLKEKYPQLDIIVQPSSFRAFNDQSYSDEGIELNEDLSSCDLIMGVKEVNVQDLIPGKKFMFFSHTIKKQPHNQQLIRALLDLEIEIIDYELIKGENNKRLIGFGRYAGVVGAYNAFLTLGLKYGNFDLKPAHLCTNREEMEAEVKKVILPKNFKLVLTGFGRVGHGAREVLKHLPIQEVNSDEFINHEFDYPVFTQLDVAEYFARKDGIPFIKSDFYNHPEKFRSTFARFIPVSDMYITCHFWSNRSPVIITNEDLDDPERRLMIVADISCDMNGPIASTIRESRISDPIYGYNPLTDCEDDYRKDGVIAVMAIDNLPCELPLEASENFGNELINEIFPYLMGEDPNRVIERATITREGKLMPDFRYLQDYADGLFVN
jgi:saccharopine dehydrogenase (NAD+, L-lysine-forming)